MPKKLLVGDSQKCGSLKVIKKVAPPTVPNIAFKVWHEGKLHSTSNPCICNYNQNEIIGEKNVIYSNLNSSRRLCRSSCIDNIYLPVPFSCESSLSSMKKINESCGYNGQIHLAQVTVHNQPDNLSVTSIKCPHSSNVAKDRLLYGSQIASEDQGIDVSSLGRYSPGGSSGGSSISRHSLSSLDSGRASASNIESKAISRRLSVHSYESIGSPQRISFHSSNSSLASSEDPHGAYISATASAVGSGPNVAEMVLHGLPDIEILSNWLSSLNFEEYIPFFLQAGYDMPTITRMTPEDLTAIGITKPNHRRKLKSEITKLNISDGIPEYKPNTLLEWLKLLRLEEYCPMLFQQKIDSVDRVADLTWEDFEDIGIQKLGHQKRLILAIKRIEDINQGRRPNLIPPAKIEQRLESQSHSNTVNNISTTGSHQFSTCPPVQDVAISLQCPKNSPSIESINEMKTFQQLTVENENTVAGNVSATVPSLNSTEIPQLLPNSSIFHSNNDSNSNQVLTSNKGRSLESLHSEDNAINITPTPPVNIYPAVAFSNSIEKSKPPIPKNWKMTDLDAGYNYESEGTATLNRPKAMMKLIRPVAKLSSKEKEDLTEVMLDIPDHEFKSFLNQTKSLDGWSSLDSSPRHNPTTAKTSTIPRANTMRRPPPPPPPKRSNSIKGDKANKETSPLNKQSVILQKHTNQVSSSSKTEDFPPPPSSATVENSKSDEKADELFNNPLFQQRRKDSAGNPNKSTLPSTNDVTAAVKQKGLKLGNSLKNNHRGMNAPGVSLEGHPYDQSSEALSPGDVIDDIENMLANLSDQLDAMLDEEQMPTN